MTSKAVAAFTGHMVDKPGRRPPRFPADKVEAVRLAICDRIRQHNIGWGFSSAARGSDLLFVEELLKTNGHAHVFLPFPKADFAQTSVGYGWDERYNRALNNKNVEVNELSNKPPSDPDQEAAAYAACNAKIFEAAKARANQLGQKPILLAVWNGNPGDGKGGTADAVRDWQGQGNPVEVIDISRL